MLLRIPRSMACFCGSAVRLGEVMGPDAGSSPTVCGYLYGIIQSRLMSRIPGENESKRLDSRIVLCVDFIKSKMTPEPLRRGITTDQSASHPVPSITGVNGTWEST